MNESSILVDHVQLIIRPKLMLFAFFCIETHWMNNILVVQVLSRVGAEHNIHLVIISTSLRSNIYNSSFQFTGSSIRNDGFITVFINGFNLAG